MYEDCVAAHRAFEAHSSRHPIRRRRFVSHAPTGADCQLYGLPLDLSAADIRVVFLPGLLFI